MSDEVTFTTTDRGFKHLTPVPGCYGGDVKIHESSSAEHPRVWIGITEADDINAAALAVNGGPAYTGGHHEASALLSVAAVEQLRAQLDWILEHHYQGDVRGYVETE